MNSLNKKLILTALAGGLVVYSAQAQTTAVQWGIGTDIVTGAYFGPNINSTALNLTTPKTDPLGGGYYRGDPDRSINRSDSVNVYAAAWTNSANAGAEAHFRVLPANFAAWHPAIYDTMILNTTSGGGGHSAGGIAFWQKSDGFINGFSAETLNFADLRIRAVVANNSEGFGNLKSNHLVVRQGADFYVSNDVGGALANMTMFTTLNDIENLVTTWYVYNPVADASLIGTVANPILNDITGIGILNLVDSIPDQFYSFMVAEFSVTVIPEPSTYALLFGFLALGWVLWRRRARRL